jgi:leucyl aminopeptidase
MKLKVNFATKLSKAKAENEIIFVKNQNLKNKNLKPILKFVLESKLFQEELFIQKEYNKRNYIFINCRKLTLSSDYENIGSKLFDYLNNSKIENSYIDIGKVDINNIQLEKILHGVKLKSYSFDIYKSNNKKNKTINLNIVGTQTNKSIILRKKLNALLQGVFFARDLVSEPPNVLTTDKYVKRLLSLKRIGIKIKVYDEKKMKKMGMHSLLGVGKGSLCGSYLVTMEWNGGKKNQNPLAFVGKGVCFDTGGISLKPARFMEEMKYDMAGSAVVSGLIKSLALRKAKINAVGVVGLVENMPGGNAQRPGDIIKSYCGKTIEVLNTDAEGRLVLADALTFTEKKFKPLSIVDLATLTGAIIVCLGEEYAGLFSNNDNLSEKLFKAGKFVDEKVWRLPLHENYDKLINSKIADVQNINYSGGAGSITAAQFLQRFILNKTPWAHIDIAGMAFSKKAAKLNPGGATGFGVRLLNKFLEENYE